MKNTNVKKMVAAAMFAAMVYVSTMVIQISIPSGYINFWDAFVLMAGFTLGPVYGGLAAAIGSSLADLIAFPAYAPATFVIKFLVALSAAFLSKKISSNKKYFISSFIGELVMVAGYFVYESIFIKLGFGALASVPFNAIQGTVAVVVSVVIMNILTRNKSLKQLFDFK